MERNNWVTSAVVAVTSVQPTSEKRTIWQLIGSRLPAGGVAGSLGAGVTLPAAAPAAAATGRLQATRRAQHGSVAASLTRRRIGRHDWSSGSGAERAFN